MKTASARRIRGLGGFALTVVCGCTYLNATIYCIFRFKNNVFSVVL